LCAAAFCSAALNALFCRAVLNRVNRAGMQFRQETRFWAIAGVGTVLETVALCSPAPSWKCVLLLIGLSASTVSAAADAATGYIFDAVTLPSLAALLAFGFVFGHGADVFLGASASGGAVLVLYIATASRGIGLGDFKIACCIGAALGWCDGLAALGAAFIAGGMYAAIVLCARPSARGTEVAFGPYLAAGMMGVAYFRMLA
jgi:prepilin signal peptidase PulO-like enzyme (type II secretory pathway)